MEIMDLGIKSYDDALCVQREVLLRRIEGKSDDTLILVEHHPVVTLGRLSGDDSIPCRGHLEKKGIPVVSVGRGGRATFHAPGQLVMYPIIDLSGKKKDIARYIDFLEKTVARSLVKIGVQAARVKEQRGIWVGAKKIAFTGVAVKKWVTYHGVAININNDTGGFSLIHPCGDKNMEVISARELLGRALDMSKVKAVFIDQFRRDIEKEYEQAEGLAALA